SCRGPSLRSDMALLPRVSPSVGAMCPRAPTGPIPAERTIDGHEESPLRYRSVLDLPGDLAMGSASLRRLLVALGSGGVLVLATGVAAVAAPGHLDTSFSRDGQQFVD